MSGRLKFECPAGRKVQQVLEGARQVFLRDGFEGASVDAIAREAGVSKATLYNYFADKRVLFLNVGKAECVRQGDMSMCGMDPDASAAEVLAQAGTAMQEFITSEFGQRIFRICVAESERFPELAREFYETGPLVARNRLIDYLRLAVERGELTIEEDEFVLAAEQFHELCKADIMPRVVFGMKPPTADERRHAVDEAVRMFLARYGARQGGREAVAAE